MGHQGCVKYLPLYVACTIAAVCYYYFVTHAQLQLTQKDGSFFFQWTRKKLLNITQ